MEWLETLIVRLNNKINCSDNPELVARCVNMVARAKMVCHKANGSYFIR